MEFIQWSKTMEFPLDPGRGSGAGSLVAYALKITDLDPLEFDLLFERFLNQNVSLCLILMLFEFFVWMVEIKSLSMLQKLMVEGQCRKLSLLVL